MGKCGFLRRGSDVNTIKLKGLVAAGVSGHSDALSYFFYSAQKVDASEETLAGVADVAAVASGLKVYSLISKRENETDV